jgi:hypothetical protein
MFTTTTPGKGSKLAWWTGASADDGSATKGVSSLRLRSSSGCAHNTQATLRNRNGTSVEFAALHERGDTCD